VRKVVVVVVVVVAAPAVGANEAKEGSEERRVS
jgi:hypothetical protein